MEDLPDDVLVNEILPRLSSYRLAQVCSVSPRLAALCSGEDLWRVKSFLDFPSDAPLRSMNTSWRDYYRFLSSLRIPLHYRGEIIAFIPWDRTQLELMRDIVAKHLPVDELNVVLVDSQRRPVLAWRHLNGPIVPIRNDWSNVVRAVAFDGPELRLDNATIQLALFSPHGQPPIYGTRAVVGSTTNDFRIIDRTGNTSIPLFCDNLSVQNLSGIAGKLGLPVEFYPDVAFMKLKLCHRIEERLTQIGHFI